MTGQPGKKEIDLPLGMRKEDQISWAPQSGVRGGQLMTG